MDSNHFAAISLVLTTSTLITGINTLLSFYGWQTIAVFHEVSLEGGESAFLAHQIVLTLSVGGASTGPFKVVRRQGLRQGMNHAELLADKYSQLDGQPSIFCPQLLPSTPFFGHLGVSFFLTDGICGPTFTLFDYSSSIVSPVEAMQSLEGWHQPGAPPVVQLSAGFFRIPGCNLRQNRRSSAILAALSTINGTAALENEFAVFIGPPMTGDCGLVSDWISLGDQGDSQDLGLYEISYLCRRNIRAEALATVVDGDDRKPFGAYMNSFSTPSNTRKYLKALTALFYRYRCKYVVMFYELSSDITDNGFFANELSVLLANAIILLTRPALAKEFLIETRNVTAIKQGIIAIIHIEPTDMLTYDILRLWRNELESGVDLGAAGQSLIIMTTLPTRTIYQPNSSIYTNDVYVPITPEITFHFENYSTNEIRGLYDMFIFSLNLEVSFGRRNVSQMTFDEIFLLTDVILWPLIAVQRVADKVWPGDSNGPSRNPCLIYDCEMAGSVQEITLIILGGIIIVGVSNLARIVYIRRLRQEKRVLGGNAKLILYADDISYVREGKHVSVSI
ncbi:unnamed protein product [Dibothriocephalus latus]|uniref:Uncharacterized protein n=1 Tax=Dibothriocephalus latus TaxID=60516 RepID=A0A3P7P8A8_DIBLA|nr:unnamed protein product [Dibothriocephalus latus]